jgi:tRNA pseudouridine55 synthase
MKARRGATGLAGILAIDKPAGMTSHDVVNALRSATGEGRIGHAGTLDPMATGLLLVLFGRATRLEHYLVGHDKRYEARIVFGIATDTLDAEGQVTAEAPVPESILDGDRARELLRTLLGPQLQVPPAYSAIKRGGVAAHRIARAGGSPNLEPRAVEVYEAQLRAIDAATPAWDVSLAVSKGTYIRSLAADIGVAAGTVAHLGALRRTHIGSAGVAEALSLDASVTAARAGGLEPLMLDPVSLLGLPVLALAPQLLRDGRSVPADEEYPEGQLIAVVSEASLRGIYRRSGPVLIPETVFEPGVAR